MFTEQLEAVTARARQRAERPGPEIFDSSFFDLEKNLILNPEPGPDLKFSPDLESPALCRALVTATQAAHSKKYDDKLQHQSHLYLQELKSIEKSAKKVKNYDDQLIKLNDDFSALAGR